MIGFVLGPLLWGPLSEYVGRKPVLLSSYTFYVTFTLVCSSSPTYGALLGFRLLCGVSAAAPTTVISGLYADILDDPSQRGLAIALFMTSNTSGALVAPTISGFASYLSWRWPFWVAGIIASPGIFLLLLIPETYAPVLLHRTARGDKETNRTNPLEKMVILGRSSTFEKYSSGQ
ncbi:major facilitator superfamily domain-containing protein [Penicillium hetheringtonii]|uniref:Major facilitator superfamily domain-containing protein n=1 Tax=Penicillium hetheringtonii TaxID=911720 RepID=A0AAD6DCP4_9EURO|nr:major facilitator superfamily domain-containing protein [Penicillium hetheringtonii]